MIDQLPATALRRWLDDASRDAPLILDVRERWECAICAIPDAQWMPMQEVPARWSELPRQQDIVVVCHHGMRSLQVAHYLERAGFSGLYNLSGGIAGWASEVDPAMPQY